jgi:hypothetical protein
MNMERSPSDLPGVEEEKMAEHICYFAVAGFVLRNPGRWQNVI